MTVQEQNTPRNRRQDSVYSKTVRAGKIRTYFFDVRQTRSEDFYLTITESKRRFNGQGYERHNLHLYKEDFNKFIEGLQEAIDHIKTDLLPDFDYDQYSNRYFEDQEGYESSQSETTEALDTSDVVEEVEEEEEEVVEEEEDDNDDDLMM